MKEGNNKKNENNQNSLIIGALVLAGIVYSLKRKGNKNETVKIKIPDIDNVQDKRDFNYQNKYNPTSTALSVTKDNSGRYFKWLTHYVGTDNNGKKYNINREALYFITPIDKFEYTFDDVGDMKFLQAISGLDKYGNLIIDPAKARASYNEIFTISEIGSGIVYEGKKYYSNTDETVYISTVTGTPLNHKFFNQGKLIIEYKSVGLLRAREITLHKYK